MTRLLIAAVAALGFSAVGWSPAEAATMACADDINDTQPNNLGCETGNVPGDDFSPASINSLAPFGITAWQDETFFGLSSSSTGLGGFDGTLTVTGDFTKIDNVLAVFQADDQSDSTGFPAEFFYTLAVPTSGDLTFDWLSPFAFGGKFAEVARIEVYATPIPAPLALLGAGLAIMGFIARRRRAAA